ncbi:MAG: DUF4154 domain-containing protein, partial [Crocinitomicaceae bacterium]|nr:DUF4154 domain-containing protein [Crocinitomicaceae bacterium]
MTSYIRYILIGLTTILLLNNGAVFAQKFTEDQVQSAYIFEISEYIIWKKETNTIQFTIGVLEEAPNMSNILKEIAKDKMIKNKRVEVVSFSSVREIQGVDLLFVDQLWNARMNQVFNQINDKHMFLFTEKCEDKSNIMINFAEKEEGKIRFEVNKANTLLQGFQLLPKLLLLGGTELDVAELYEELEKEVIQVRLRLLKQEKELLEQKEKLEEQIALIQNQSVEITQKEDELGSLYDALDETERLLSVNERQLFKGNQELELKLNVLSKREKEIGELSKKIQGNLELMQRQDQEIKSREEHIKTQNRSIEEQGVKLDVQKSELFERNTKIQQQRTLIVGSLAALVIFALMLGWIIYMNRERKKANTQLSDQNVKLKKIRLDLESTLALLKTTQQKLVQTEKMSSIGILTRGIAHELNNPMTFVLSGMEGLVEDLADFQGIVKKYEEYDRRDGNDDLKKEVEAYKKEKDYEFLVKNMKDATKDILSGANRTVDIIKSLSQFTILDYEKMILSDIHSEIDYALTQLKIPSNKKINIDKDYDKTLAKFKCLPGQMNKVLTNLFRNAAYAIQKTGEIGITTRKVDDKLFEV